MASPLAGSCFFGVASQHRPPAVDRHGRPIDEATLVREQVRDGGRHLFGTPYPADQMQEAHLLLDPRGYRRLLPDEELFVALGGDRTERYGVDPDTVRPVVDGQRARDPSARWPTTTVRTRSGSTP